MNRVTWDRSPLALIAGAALVLAGCGPDPRQLLDDMSRAYRGASRYADDARVTVRRTQGDAATEVTHPFRVAFVRPAMFRIEAYDARIVADGKTLRAAVGAVPGQVLVEPVQLHQDALTLDQIVRDDALRTTLTEGEAGCPTQLPLLLADDTVDLILADATAPPRVVGSETVDGHACTRLAIDKPDGVLVLWIDPAAKLLRRMRVPTAAYADELSRQAGAPVGVAVDVEFTGASFEADVPDEAFAFDVPAGAAEVSRLEPLQPPPPVHPRIGEQAGLPPLATVDGQPLTRDAVGAAVVVLDFFFAGCGPAARSLPQVAAGVAEFVKAYARDHGGERPALKHVAVSLDPDDVPAAAIRRTLAEFGGVGLLARDPQAVSAQALGLETFPASVIIAGDGRIADVILGDHPRIAADVTETLTALARGVDTGPLVRRRHERRLGDYRRDLDRAAGGARRLPEQVIAPRRQPVRFKLERAWRADGVALPGNVVCLDATRGMPDPRIVALDGWRTVVELDAEGAERGRHELDLPADAGVGFLRTAVARDGRRWWLAARRGGRQAFVFDETWRRQAAIPADGGTAAESLVAADIADLDGDGVPDVVVAFAGGGVEIAPLAAERSWRGGSTAPVVDLVVGGTTAGASTRELLAVTAAGGIERISPRAPEHSSSLPPSGPPLVALTAGPVATDGAWALIGIAAAPFSCQEALGIDPATLERQWSLSLGDGVHRDGPIEPVAWADLLGTSRRQWLIAAPDGSVTVAWANGGVVDRYRHGKPLVGIGGYRQGGRGYVVLATRDGLEAHEVTDVALD